MNFVAGQRRMCDVKDLFNPLERQARDHEVPRELRRPGSLAASALATAAGMRMARLLPHLATCMTGSVDKQWKNCVSIGQRGQCGVRRARWGAPRVDQRLAGRDIDSWPATLSSGMLPK